MLLSGWPLALVLAVLSIWLTILIAVSRRAWWACSSNDGPRTRPYLTVAGLAFGAVGVTALLLMHLTWTSAALSQRLGTGTIHVLAIFLFWSTIAGLLCSLTGSGKLRFLGAATSLFAGFWWVTLWIGAAISMGASTVRHPTRYLIRESYVGWVEVKYGERSAPPLPVLNGTVICRFSKSARLETSSLLEDGWAKDEYLYSSIRGATRELPSGGLGQGNMIWGETTSWRASSANDVDSKRITLQFYVGTEQQFHNANSPDPVR